MLVQVRNRCSDFDSYRAARVRSVLNTGVRSKGSRSSQPSRPANDHLEDVVRGTCHLQADGSVRGRGADRCLEVGIGGNISPLGRHDPIALAQAGGAGRAAPARHTYLDARDGSRAGRLLQSPNDCLLAVACAEAYAQTAGRADTPALVSVAFEFRHGGMGDESDGVARSSQAFPHVRLGQVGRVSFAGAVEGAVGAGVKDRVSKGGMVQRCVEPGKAGSQGLLSSQGVEKLARAYGIGR